MVPRRGRRGHLREYRSPGFILSLGRSEATGCSNIADVWEGVRGQEGRGTGGTDRPVAEGRLLLIRTGRIPGVENDLRGVLPFLGS